ncbi:MAG: hypothetical protein KGM91_28270, partial [Burkholderiales bacterium]|nr:hypothetical protein [Burkholderiales bacterium]
MKAVSIHPGKHAAGPRLRGTMLRAALGLLAALALAPAFAEGGCGDLANAYGPFDYRTDRDKLPIVNLHHFTPQVQALVQGQEGQVGGDLDYVLRAFPNHYPALLTVVKYGEKTNSAQPPDLPRPIECYFERAIRFQPEDAIVRVIYAKFLTDRHRKADAMAQLAIAMNLSKDNELTQQNVGLAYVDLKEFGKA